MHTYSFAKQNMKMEYHESEIHKHQVIISGNKKLAGNIFTICYWLFIGIVINTYITILISLFYKSDILNTWEYISPTPPMEK